MTAVQNGCEEHWVFSSHGGPSGFALLRCSHWTIGTADAILPGDGVKPLSGAILAIISLADATLVAIVVSVKFSKLVEPAFLGYKV